MNVPEDLLPVDAGHKSNGNAAHGIEHFMEHRWFFASFITAESGLVGEAEAVVGLVGAGGSLCRARA